MLDDLTTNAVSRDEANDLSNKIHDIIKFYTTPNQVSSSFTLEDTFFIKDNDYQYNYREEDGNVN
jgi:hypothetical protein